MTTKEAIGKAVASVASGAVCGMLVYYSHSGWGAGWMCLAMIIIWVWS